MHRPTGGSAPYPPAVKVGQSSEEWCFGELHRRDPFGEAASVDLAAAWTSGTWPFVVGLLVWSIGLPLGGPTGYAINPARDLGPRIMLQILPIPEEGTSDWAYGWIPVVGPLIGAIIVGLAGMGLLAMV